MAHPDERYKDRYTVDSLSYYHEQHAHDDDVPSEWSNGEGMDKEADVDINLQTPPPHHHIPAEKVPKQKVSFAHKAQFWNRIRLPKKALESQISWWDSAQNMVFSSWVNVFFVFLPVGWITNQFADDERETGRISHIVPFAFNFLSLIPLSRLLEYVGENLAMYCGKDLGDLIEVTVNNAVEAILALILLLECELKILQSSTVGVVLLRLLLVPGLSFITGGFRVQHQELHPHLSGLNQSLLTAGVLILTLPISFFTALDPGQDGEGNDIGRISDRTRNQLLSISRGLAFILLAVYVASRFFLHTPSGGDDHASLAEREDAPEEMKKAAAHLAEEEPEMNFWACIIAILITLALLATTAQFLVKNIEPLRDKIFITEEWFGLILLPAVSFSADMLLSLVAFVRTTFFKHDHLDPHTMAEYRPFELSIQFLMFWIPLLIILGWMTHKPMSLLFDLFEVVVLVAACFLVNYVTADSKTNWAEGVMLVALYLAIALTAFFYEGQSDMEAIQQCDSVKAYLANINQTTTPHPEFLSSANNSSDKKVEITDIPVSENSSLANANLTQKLQALLALYDVLLKNNVEMDVDQEGL